MKNQRPVPMIFKMAVIASALASLGGCASMFNPIGDNKYDCNRKENPDSPYCHSFRSVERATSNDIPDSRYDQSMSIAEIDKLTGIAPVNAVAVPATQQPVADVSNPQILSNAAVPAGYETYDVMGVAVTHRIKNTSLQPAAVIPAPLISAPAVPNYACQTGYTLNGTTCSTTITTLATPNYSCVTGNVVAGNSCFIVSQATVNGYSCQTGLTLSGTTCSGTLTIPASISGYACPIGYTLNGTSCTHGKALHIGATPVNKDQTTLITANGVSITGSQATIVSTALPHVSNAQLPAGYELHEMEDTNSAQTTNPTALATTGDSNCQSATGADKVVCDSALVQANQIKQDNVQAEQASVPGTPIYACPTEYSLSGYALKGNTCSKLTTSQATPNYTCPDGQAVSGNTCQSTNAATVTSYSCQTGFTLNGTTCSGILTNPASIVSFTCPTGYTLSDSICTKPAAQQMVASAALPDGTPVRIGPLVQRVWIKSYNDKNDMLTSDQVVYKEIVPTHWAGQAPIQGSQGIVTGGIPGAYPHRPIEQPVPLITTPSLLQTDKKDSNTSFSQPGSQSQNGETAPELSDNSSKSMPN